MIFLALAANDTEKTLQGSNPDERVALHSALSALRNLCVSPTDRPELLSSGLVSACLRLALEGIEDENSAVSRALTHKMLAALRLALDGSTESAREVIKQK